LFQIKEKNNCCIIAEIEPFAKSLNNQNVFILHSISTQYIWVSQYASDKEQEFAKTASKIIKGNNSTLVKVLLEGSEPNEFWTPLLGGKQKYCPKSYKSPQAIKWNPKLFALSTASGPLTVDPVFNFMQDDLDPQGVYILDAFDEIFIWIGEKSPKFLQKFAIEIATEYIATSPTPRPSAPLKYIVMKPEPVEFARHFLAWRWSTSDKKPAELVSVEDHLKLITHTYKDLLSNSLPPGVDSSKLEKYLSDEDFLQIFRMNKYEFNQLPVLQKDKLKQENYLSS